MVSCQQGWLSQYQIFFQKKILKELLQQYFAYYLYYFFQFFSPVEDPEIDYLPPSIVLFWPFLCLQTISKPSILTNQIFFLYHYHIVCITNTYRDRWHKTVQQRSCYRTFDYRSQARLIHPDKHPASQKEKYEALFVQLAEAYSVLSDDSKRQAYDNGKYNDNFNSNFDDQMGFRRVYYSENLMENLLSKIILNFLNFFQAEKKKPRSLRVFHRWRSVILRNFNFSIY